MKRFSFGLALLACTAAFALAACERNVDKSGAFAAETSDNRLRGEAFGISVKRPDDWRALGYEELNDLIEGAVEPTTEGDDDLRARAQAGVKKSHNLFLISKYEMGAAADENATVSATAEMVRLAPGVASGRDYLARAKEVMIKTNMDYGFDGAFKSRVIDGVAFDQMDCTLTFAGGVNQ